MSGFVIGDRSLRLSGDTHSAWLASHAQVGSYLVVGASAVGQIHLARGLPRDDAFAVRCMGPWLAAAASDGVGSRPLSRYGATYVVEAMTALLLRPLAPPLKGDRSASRSGVHASMPTDTAPPAHVDEGVLRMSRVRASEHGALALAAGLTEWGRRVMGAPSPETLVDVTPPIMRQAASTGWWLPTLSAVAGTQPVAGSASRAGAPADETSRSSSALGVPAASDVMRRAFEGTHAGLREHAHSLGVDLADLSCTALALLLNLETGTGVVGQIGDGAIMGLTARGNVRRLVEAVDTEDPQATYTISRPDFLKYYTPQLVEQPDADRLLAVFVMTDGLSGDLLYSADTGALQNWAQAVRHNLLCSPSPAQAASGMLNWLATYHVKGSWDDRTLVVITRMGNADGDS
ncbi:MAG TPA: protein phosphatase 2C domain-containing protein, partial [Anaerolineae bacterium]|nr:protein phosphatase 2C domain-containing protein [Anaerolineae bacterium]